MIPKFIRKLFGTDTGKLRYEAHRENMHRACDKNIEVAAARIEQAESKIIKPVQPIKRKRSLPRLHRWHGPESI
jgi:hypothetical protein